MAAALTRAEVEEAAMILRSSAQSVEDMRSALMSLWLRDDVPGMSELEIQPFASALYALRELSDYLITEATLLRREHR